MATVTAVDIGCASVAASTVRGVGVGASGSTILYQWNGTGTTATVGDDPTFPTVGDSGNNNRMEFDGSVWSYVNEDEPRFFDDKGYMAEGAATELSGRSADLTNWTGINSPAVAQDAVGLSGSSNEAFTLTDDDGAQSEYFQHLTTVPNDSNTYFMVVRVGYEAAPGTYPFIRIRLAGGTSINQSVILDKASGAYVEIDTDGSVVSVTRRQGTFDHWEVILAIPNNSTGNTSARMYLYPAGSSDGTNLAVSATGSTVVASAELYKDNYSFSPILTTGGTTKTRLADTGATLPFDWSECDAEGSIELTLTPFFIDATGGQQGIVTPIASSAARLLYFGVSLKSTQTFDGTNSRAYSSWSDVGETLSVKMRWGGGTMRHSVDGVSAASSSFDGSFDPSGLVTLFKSLTRCASIKSLTVYTEDKGDDWLTE